MIALTEFLASEVRPALGCTEPGAVALAVARAREEAAGKLESVRVIVSRSIYKNGVAVGIPGTDGLKGNDIAAALAVLYGKSSYGLEVLKDTPAGEEARALELLTSGTVVVTPDMKRNGVYVEATVKSDSGEATCIIADKHDNIVKVIRNGSVTLDTAASAAASTTPVGLSVPDQMAKLSFVEAMAIVDTMTPQDVDTVMHGVDMNLEMARYGLDHIVGLGVGKMVATQVRDNEDVALRIKAWTAAAADARMSGVNKPVMSSAGSGNHGLTAVIPVAIFAQYLGKTREETARAVAFSHLVTSFIKSRIGRLSPICGCTVSAGAGAAAAMTWMKTGSIENAAHAISLILGNLSGMVCDGAKESCALKVGSGAMEAYHASMLATDGCNPDKQGLIGDIVEKSVANLAKMSNLGMADMDTTLIDIILDS